MSSDDIEQLVRERIDRELEVLASAFASVAISERMARSTARAADAEFDAALAESIARGFQHVAEMLALQAARILYLEQRIDALTSKR